MGQQDSFQGLVSSAEQKISITGSHLWVEGKDVKFTDCMYAQRGIQFTVANNIAPKDFTKMNLNYFAYYHCAHLTISSNICLYNLESTFVVFIKVVNKRWI